MSILAEFVFGAAMNAAPPMPTIKRNPQHGFGRQHRTQVLAAMKEAVILRETRQIRRAADRAMKKGRTA